jgi:hypothetical protein
LDIGKTFSVSESSYVQRLIELLPEAARVTVRRNDEPVRPARGKALINVDLFGRWDDWHPARGFHHGPEQKRSTKQRPKIRLQSDFNSLAGFVRDLKLGDKEIGREKWGPISFQ